MCVPDNGGSSRGGGGGSGAEGWGGIRQKQRPQTPGTCAPRSACAGLRAIFSSSAEELRCERQRAAGGAARPRPQGLGAERFPWGAAGKYSPGGFPSARAARRSVSGARQVPPPPVLLVLLVPGGEQLAGRRFAGPCRPGSGPSHLVYLGPEGGKAGPQPVGEWARVGLSRRPGSPEQHLPKPPLTKSAPGSGPRFPSAPPPTGQPPRFTTGHGHAWASPAVLRPARFFAKRRAKRGRKTVFPGPRTAKSAGKPGPPAGLGPPGPGVAPASRSGLVPAARRRVSVPNRAQPGSSSCRHVPAPARSLVVLFN